MAYNVNCIKMPPSIKTRQTCNVTWGLSEAGVPNLHISDLKRHWKPLFYPLFLFEIESPSSQPSAVLAPSSLSALEHRPRLWGWFQLVPLSEVKIKTSVWWHLSCLSCLLLSTSWHQSVVWPCNLYRILHQLQQRGIWTKQTEKSV